MADDIIGSVGVSVVPNARGFWADFQRQTEGKATEAGRKSGNDWQRGFEASTRGMSVNVRADTTQARAQIAALNSSGKGGFGGLIQAALTLAPAIVPIGAAAGAAGAEMVALGAAGILAIKGIQDEMKTGTPLGIEYRTVLDTLKGSLDQLEGTASKGVLAGFEQSVGKLRREMPQLNAVIADQSRILGDVASHLTGGLVGGFTTFAPLLDQVGHSVDRIAAHFETWATGPGGAKFSEVLSKDYAAVAPVLDDLGHSIAHIIAASNGVGLGIISELGLLARVIDSFPTPVLTAMVAGFVSFRSINAIKGVINGLSTSFPLLAAQSTAAAAATTAANLQQEASAAQAAAVIATTQAEAAGAFAAAQAQIARSVVGTEGELTGLAAVAVRTSAAEAAAFQAAATEAQAAAARIAAAAEAAAIASRGAAAKASLSWSAMLGPIGIAVGAVALLGLSFLGSSHSTQDATASVQGYTAALIASNNVINDSVKSNIAKALGDAHAFDNGRQLGLVQSQLITAVTGTDAAYQKLRDSLLAVDKAGGGSGNVWIDHTIGAHTELGRAAASLIIALDQEHKNFATSVQAARDQEAALLGVADATDAEKRAISDGTTATRGWIDATNAFSASADTAADRAKLIGAALVAANGDMLGYAHTMVGAAVANQQLATDFANLHKGVIDLKTGTIDFHNAAAGPLINDLQALQTAAMNAAAATYQHELATKGAKQAADDAFAVYKNDTRGALIDNAKQLGLTSDQAGRLADKYFGIKNSGDLKKKIELIGEDKVARALNGILRLLRILAGQTTQLTLDIAAANAAAVRAGTANTAGSSSGAVLQADGGYISGPGGPRSDSINARLSNGEFVVNAAQTSKHRGLLEAVNSGAPGFEQGGFVNVDTSGLANKYGVRKKAKAATTTYIVLGQQYASLPAAENAAARAFHANVTLGVKIDTKDLTAFKASLKGTAEQANAAFLTIYNDAKKLGISDGLAAALLRENKQLDHAINDRNKAAANLAAVTAKFKALQGDIKAAITGSFDITSAGKGFDGNQPITGQNILAEQKQAAERVKRFVADIKKLTGKLDGTYLKQLATKGPDALPEAEALLTLSKTELGSLNATERTINAAGQDLGTSVGQHFYGADMNRYKLQEKRDEKLIDNLAKKMAKQFTDAADRLANRPIVIKVDGRVIARVTATGANSNARR